MQASPGIPSTQTAPSPAEIPTGTLFSSIQLKIPFSYVLEEACTGLAVSEGAKSETCDRANTRSGWQRHTEPYQRRAGQEQCSNERQRALLAADLARLNTSGILMIPTQELTLSSWRDRFSIPLRFVDNWGFPPPFPGDSSSLPGF